MAYGNLLNAFSSGLVDGARTGALMDATFAEQDNRAMQEDARNVQGFVDYLAATGNDFSKALSTPDGQQMAFKAIASNPAVRESFASNPGFEPVGMVQGPDGRFAFVGRGEDGSIKPLTAGGKPVTYDGSQLMAMTAASAGRLGVNNTAQGQADFEAAAGAGDVFDTLEQQGLGPAAELRALSQQGNEFIQQGGIPRQKPGIPAIRAAVRPAKSTQKEAVIPESKAPAEKAKLSVPSLLKKPEAVDPLIDAVASSLTPEEIAASNEAMKDGPKGVLTPPPASGNKFKDDRQARANQMLARISQASAELAGGSDAQQESDKPFMTKLGEGVSAFASGVGKSARTVVDNAKARAEDVSNAAGAVADAAGGLAADFKRGFTGQEVPKAEQKPAQVSQTKQAPAQAPAQQSVAQKAVQRERVSRKVMDSPEKLDQLDTAFVEQIRSETPQVRVQNDGRALDRLAKLSAGKKPNSAQLHAAYRLAKSGLLSAQSLAEFSQTGRLSNVVFDNAYKEHNIRQGYAQLAQADRRLNFDMFKEQRDEARSLRGQQMSVMKEVLRQRGLADKEAQKAAEKLDKEGRGMLTQTVASQFRQMPRYKDASDSVIKDEADAAVSYMLANPQYVGTMLGGRTTPASMPDFVVLSEGIPDMVNQTVGSDGFWSSKTVLGHAFERFKNAQKSLTGGQ